MERVLGLGMWPWEGGQGEEEQAAYKSDAEPVCRPHFCRISASGAHVEKRQIHILLVCSHSSCLDMHRNTFADIDSNSHQPYVPLKADARPTS